MLIHASCVAIDDSAVLLIGPPGVGKSDLALRLIDGGAMLVSDDQTVLQCENNILMASPPPSIAGLIEARHIGLLRLPFCESAPVVMTIELSVSGEGLERLPDPDFVFFLDQRVQRLRLPSFAASTPAKIRAALAYPLKSDVDIL